MLFGSLLIIFEYFTSLLVFLAKSLLYKQKIRVLPWLPLILDINRIAKTSTIIKIIIWILYVFCRKVR